MAPPVPFEDVGRVDALLLLALVSPMLLEVDVSVLLSEVALPMADGALGRPTGVRDGDDLARS